MSSGIGQAGFTVLDTDVYVHNETCGTTTALLFHENPNRLLVELKAADTNLDTIEIGHNSTLLSATVYDFIIPAGESVFIRREDKRGYFGRSSTAAQVLQVNEYIMKVGVPIYPKVEQTSEGRSI